MIVGNINSQKANIVDIFLNQKTYQLTSNLLAKKSPFVYDQTHFWGNINFLKTNEKNILLLKELYSNYKNNIKTDLNKLNIFDLAILIPTEKEILFSGNYQKIKINNEFILILINNSIIYKQSFILYNLSSFYPKIIPSLECLSYCTS